MEQSGDIHWVGQWGLETIIKAYYELKQKNPNSKYKLSINLSPKQLMDEGLAVGFQNILRKIKVPQDSIILEINEYALFNRQDTIIDNIKKLKELGFMIAVDGLGLDLSSFEMIEILDIDVIKIDLRQIEEITFVVRKTIEALVEFTQKRNTILIGEGVENEKDIEKLKNSGIELAQGYHFSKPISFQDLESYLNQK